jgi:peptidoglycan/LPS O-acetylase OafA/YrhL
MSGTGYRPEIDGLRAFAILPVIFFHMGAVWMQGGFAGVDVFFVISGFLITRLILAEHDRCAFKLKEFWLRRVRRILPALITMVVATSIAGSAVFYPSDVNELGNQGVAALLSMANVFFWIRAGSYWGPAAEHSALLHTWTLSVEEQFYLFFPLMLVILLKYCKRQLVFLMAGLVVLSFSLFLYGSYHHPSATFYLLPTRAWELGSGCLLAVIAHKWRLKYSATWAVLLSSVGLVAIVTSYFVLSGEGGMVGGLVIPVLGTVFVIAFSGSDVGIASKVLTASPVVYVGKISYSLYLWHWPVIVLSRELPLGGAILASAISMLATFALSIASYHLVEQPIRRRENVVRYIMPCFAASILLSVFLSNCSEKIDIPAYSETTWKGKLYDVAPDHEWPREVKKRMEGITVLRPDVSNENAYATGGLIKHYGGDVPRVVVLGDSHALMWAGVLDEIFRELDVSASFYAASGSPPFFEIPVKRTRGTLFFSLEEKYTFDKMRFEFLNEWKPEVVVIAVAWSWLGSIETPQDLIDFLGRLGAKVLLVEQPPLAFAGDRNAPKYLSFLGVFPTEGGRGYIQKPDRPRYDKGLEMVRQIARQCPHCELVPVAGLFEKDNEVWVLDGSDVLYIDDDHLSYQGALRAKSRIKQSLRSSMRVMVQ